MLLCLLEIMWSIQLQKAGSGRLELGEDKLSEIDQQGAFFQIHQFLEPEDSPKPWSILRITSDRTTSGLIAKVPLTTMCCITQKARQSWTDIM